MKTHFKFLLLCVLLAILSSCSPQPAPSFLQGGGIVDNGIDTPAVDEDDEAIAVDEEEVDEDELAGSGPDTMEESLLVLEHYRVDAADDWTMLTSETTTALTRDSITLTFSHAQQTCEGPAEATHYGAIVTWCSPQLSLIAINNELIRVEHSAKTPEVIELLKTFRSSTD